MPHKIELLAPAGGMRQLHAALRFGADAVYCGFTRYGMRAAAGNFRGDQMREAVSLTHTRGAKLYVTLNVFAYDEDMDGLVEAAREAHELGVDAAIVADPGALRRIAREVPNLRLHVSTQANTTNAETAALWRDLGARRVVLSRELSLGQISRLSETLAHSIELEAFVHGSMCMAYSGRCLLSNHMTGRDANQGQCTQTCRWHYSVVEEKRPGQVFPVEVGDRGTQIFSACDLNMIAHIRELATAGLSALKIEGRMKNEYYVAVTVGAYRRALDAWADDPASVSPDSLLFRELNEELAKASHRPYDTGFFFGAPVKPGSAEGFYQTMEYIGPVIGYDAAAREVTIDLRNRVIVGDALEAMTPTGIKRLTVEGIYREDTGEWVQSCGHPGAVLRMPCEIALEAGDLLRGVCRNHSRHDQRGLA